MIFVIFALLHFTPAFAEEPLVIETLPPVVVEAPAAENSVPAQTSIQVPVGVGAKTIDAPMNELGVEQKSMEGLEDISLERRGIEWWLSPHPAERKIHSEWLTQTKLDLSQDQKLMTRLFGELFGAQATMEGGFFQDHRSIEYLDNQNTPYDPSDDVKKNYDLQKDTVYGKLTLQGTDWKSLADFDKKIEAIHAGPIVTGTQNKTQGSINAQWSHGVFEATPFAQIRAEQFNSALSPLYSNSTRDWRAGFQTKTNVSPDFLIQTQFSDESMDRIYSDGTSTQFNRYYGKILSQYSWLSNPWVEITAHGFGELASDQVNQAHTNQADFLWDTGIEVSSSHRFFWGVDGRLRRYALLATPSQRFGDGALLQGAPNLPDETGMRASIGPWVGTSDANLELSVFTEQSSNAPIMVAVSPTSVKTLPLGGVWTQGAEVKGSVKLGKFTVTPAYTYQDAVNASSINWQRGQAIPGRPKWVLITEARYNDQADSRGFKTGITHRFQSEDAMDLGGLWMRPAQHQLDAFVGYGKKNWEVRLVANNLLQNWNLPQNPDFQGTAAPNLLEPMIQQTELRLQCEILI